MKKTLSVVAAAMLAFSLAGCSGGSGADTSCGSYKAMDGNGQKEVVTSILKSKGQSTDALSVAGMRLSATAYCMFNGDGATLRGLDG